MSTALMQIQPQANGVALFADDPQERRRIAGRFWAKVDKSGDCWIWTASFYRSGYGQFAINRHPRPAHRVAYELLVGPIPEGLDLDHLCRNRACVNPAHLEPVTRRENLLRGESFVARQARQTHCKNGHPFTPENTRLRADRNIRVCRECGRAQNRAYKASKRKTA